MKKQKHSKESAKIEVRLQTRILFRDRNGGISDVTSDDSEYGYGLEDLKERASQAAYHLIRVHELIQLLTLAAENRSTVDAALVLRVLEEMEIGIEDCSDLSSYVHYTQKLFEEAEALPPVNGADQRKTARPLAIAS